MKIDLPGFDTVEVKDFEPLTPGCYSVVISGQEIKTAKSGDSKYINWEFTVIGEDNKGRKVFTNTSLKKDALWNLKALLEAADVAMDSTGFNTEDAVGAKLDIQVDQQEYDGKVRNRVSAKYSPCTTV